MKNAVSLFSSSGIGDLGLHANGINTVVACELLSERAELFQANNPGAKVFNGDIWELEDDIVDYYRKNFEESPFIILATPPCQGMSSNGMGKMLNDYRKGLRPKYDERNRLIIPAIHIIKKLLPEWIIFENVSNMVNTLIYDENDNLINIIDYIHQELGDDYVGEPQVINVADYGVPQNRVRLLTVFSRTVKGSKYFTSNKTFLPEPTHSREGDLLTSKWLTLRDIIWELPSLRAEKGKNISKENPLHKVPILDEKKLFWLDNTPEGKTAFNNQCINPECLYQENNLHGSKHNTEGINKARTDTPLYCQKCGELLPRPYVEDKKSGEKRLMKGFVSAYKRMYWDEPASTITQNFQYVSSDNKVHPTQTRVLSLWEAMKLQTISDYDYAFEVDNKPVKDGLIRDSIGESVPPHIIDIIVKNILKIEN
ncbi:DNA cytosine methyltransferase [Streptococcus suis]|uniref:DNA cytosine methyltransferase n=1 Tax=Streptococcus suis TaxID=1307 RepID=UPI00185F619A|nr:DNA cytosine methyltransferase [Streptococcus suis]MBY5009497.1 DNA cytosine methyltransferase [Streptococcus suis]QGJ85980.1 modification methylase [Streptococcus phage phi-SsuHCJ31_comEC]